MRWLVQQGADINARIAGEALPWAAEEGYIEVVRWLVQQGADINARNEDNETPLHLAAGGGKILGGDIEVVRWLVENGATINARDKDDWTPLHWATRGGHSEVESFLVGQKADQSF